MIPMASLAASSKLQVISTSDSSLQLRLAGEWVVGEPIPTHRGSVDTARERTRAATDRFRCQPPRSVGQPVAHLSRQAHRLLCRARRRGESGGLTPGGTGTLGPRLCRPRARRGPARVTRCRMAHPDRQPGPRCKPGGHQPDHLRWRGVSGTLGLLVRQGALSALGPRPAHRGMRGQGPPHRDPHQPPRRADTGLRRRHAAQDVRRADLHRRLWGSAWRARWGP